MIKLVNPIIKLTIAHNEISPPLKKKFNYVKIFFIIYNYYLKVNNERLNLLPIKFNLTYNLKIYLFLNY